MKAMAARRGSAVGNVDKVDAAGFTQLRKVSFAGEIHLVEKLIQQGADPNLPSNDGSTPLIAAASSGRLSVVSFLSEKAGADINKVDDVGQTCLLIAAKKGHFEVVQYLVKRGAAIDLACEKVGALVPRVLRHRPLFSSHLSLPPLFGHPGLDTVAGSGHERPPGGRAVPCAKRRGPRSASTGHDAVAPGPLCRPQRSDHGACVLALVRLVVISCALRRARWGRVVLSTAHTQAPRPPWIGQYLFSAGCR